MKPSSQSFPQEYHKLNHTLTRRAQHFPGALFRRSAEIPRRRRRSQVTGQRPRSWPETFATLHFREAILQATLPSSRCGGQGAWKGGTEAQRPAGAAACARPAAAPPSAAERPKSTRTAAFRGGAPSASACAASAPARHAQSPASQASTPKSEALRLQPPLARPGAADHVSKRGPRRPQAGPDLEPSESNPPPPKKPSSVISQVGCPFLENKQ